MGFVVVGVVEVVGIVGQLFARLFVVRFLLIFVLFFLLLVVCFGFLCLVRGTKAEQLTFFGYLNFSSSPGVWRQS